MSKINILDLFVLSFLNDIEIPDSLPEGETVISNLSIYSTVLIPSITKTELVNHITAGRVSIYLRTQNPEVSQLVEKITNSSGEELRNMAIHSPRFTIVQ